MKRTLYLTLTLLAVIAVISLRGSFTANADSTERHIYAADAIPWGPAPPFVLPGAQLAVLEGNPMASSGDYTVRLKMPDGYKRSIRHWDRLRREQGS